jgi:hypothetical protein
VTGKYFRTGTESGSEWKNMMGKIKIMKLKESRRVKEKCRTGKY